MHRFLYYLLVLTLLAASACAQNPRITEFLAANTNGLKDEDNSFQGWVEIWNPDQANPVSMFGTKLTNGTTSWNFPDIKIMPDERIVVWASGKNRTVTTAPLHLNFTLPTAAGATLELRTTGTNAILTSFTNLPAQTNNVSYGRDEVDAALAPSLVGFYTNPTPAERNNYSGSGVAGKVLLNKSSQAFSANFQVTLTQANPDPNAVIRYTLGNSNAAGAIPSATSTLYTGPININTAPGTQILRARVFQPGKLPGETETAAYLQLGATTVNFSSPMPLLVVTNFVSSTPPDTGDQMAYVWLWEPAVADGRARFTDPPTLASRVVIDRRGSSTLTNDKHNVNLEFRKARDNDDRDVSLLGMADGSDYVLGGPFEYDRSEVHNPFAYGLSRSIGRYAPDVRLVEVFFKTNAGSLNFTGTSSGDYFGIYNLMEKIRRDKDRVNVMKLDTYDNDAVSKTGGYIYKVDRLDSGDSGFSAGGQSMAYYYPKENEIKSNQRDPQEAYLTSYINSFDASLNNGTFASFLDVPAAIDHHLINVWMMNVDALRLSGYWHKQRGGKLVPGPVWDFDRAMESNDGRDDNPARWQGTPVNNDAGTDFFNTTWWNRLFLNADFYQKYIDRWVELRRGAFSEITVNALLDSLNAQMPAESINRDVARWGKGKRSGTFPGSPTVSYAATQAGEIQRIKEWLQVRANFMNSQWVTPVTLSHPGGTVAPGLTVTMSGPAGATIYYTLDGSDPRPSGGGGGVGPNVRNYATNPPGAINATTRIRARAYHAAWSPAVPSGANPPLISKWSGLTEARYSTDIPASASNLVITELNYHPTNPTTGELLLDPAWEDTDFEYVELKNTAATPVDLAGVHFTDGINFTFSGSQAITIGAGEFVIIAANPTAFAARYGSLPNVVGPFTGDLSDSGETLILESAANVDIFNFNYADNWYGPTDGNGRSLVIYNPTAPPAVFSTAANWRASSATGGSPGAEEPNFAPAPNAGPNLTGNLPSIAIAGMLNDDQKPASNGSLTASWSKVNGPGSVDFAPADAASTTASFTLPGLYHLRLSSSDGALPGFDDVAVAMRDTPSAWLTRHPGIGTLNDDPDGDGRTNYYEWALLLDPEQNAATDGSSVQVINNHLTLTFQRQKNSTFVTYTVQVTGELASWNDPQPGDLTETILADDGVVQTVRVTDNVEMSAQVKRFIRLRIVPMQ